MNHLLKLLFVLFLPIVFLFFYSFLGFGCSMGMSNDFDCRVILPLILAAIPILLIFGSLIVYSKYKNPGKPLSRIHSSIYLIVFLLPILLYVLYLLMTPSQRMTYLDGVTIESCYTEKPSVIWGKKISPQQCFYETQTCEEITEIYRADNCYQRREDFNEYDDCNVFQGSGARFDCEVEIIKQKKDINRCGSMISEAYDKNLYKARHQCVIQSLDALGDIRDITGSYNIDAEGDCSALGGIKTDACFADLSLLNDFDHYCNYISDKLPWYKQNCFDLLELKHKIN